MHPIIHESGLRNIGAYRKNNFSGFPAGVIIALLHHFYIQCMNHREDGPRTGYFSVRAYIGHQENHVGRFFHFAVRHTGTESGYPIPVRLNDSRSSHHFAGTAPARELCRCFAPRTLLPLRQQARG